MQFLSATLDVKAEPGDRDAIRAQVFQAPGAQRGSEIGQQRRRDDTQRGSPEVGVLTGDVPVVPDESLLGPLPGGPDPALEMLPQVRCSVEERRCDLDSHLVMMPPITPLMWGP